MPNQPKTFTVSTLTKMIKTALEESFFDVWVEGEISNYHHHSSGHRYFSLKDDKAVLRCAMWRPQGESLKFTPKDGQLVLVRGNISIYEKRGDYQLICQQLVPVGIGPLELAYRQLFEKLSAEGLFDPEHKQSIPEFASRIGIVTSPTGAAIRDIIQISHRRNPAIELVIYPAIVQGKGAEESISAGIEYFNNLDNVDVIIIGRGGGSLEDLWAFNTEKVVRAVLASKIPLISAVGHEIDVTLSDLVADMRAPTPSAAAELAVWSKDEFQSQVLGQIVRQASLLEKLARRVKENLAAMLARPIFTRPLELIYERQQAVDSFLRLLQSAGKNIFDNYKNRLSLGLSRLETMSPLAVLARGYSVSRLLPA
ncbi:MAG: exodeoxyribonuclease VII large subunit, partial [Candidatus Zixiibacteriota bacterium]